MSKITNGGLTRSGTGCFIALRYGNNGRQGLSVLFCFERSEETCRTERTRMGA